MNQTAKKRAVVLLSGGLDSATALAWASKEKGWECYSIAFDYGQRHRIELEASKHVSEMFDVKRHQVIAVDLHAIGGSALTSEMDVPKDQAASIAIPSTYVPARNLIFLSLAAAFAETVGASKLVIGANVVDYSGYPDCRPEFLDAFAKTVDLGTKAGVEGEELTIHTPLMNLTKSEIILMGTDLCVDYGLTVSCYQANEHGEACGLCDSCRLRREGFQQAGIQDPTKYYQ